MIAGPMTTCNAAAVCVRGAVLICSALACLSLGVTHAAVYKCTGADAKVVISDQPCTNDQRGGAMTVNPASGAGKVPSSAPPKLNPSPPALGSDAGVASLRAGLLAALSPECQNLSRRFWDLADRVSKATTSAPVNNAAGDALIAEFAGKCEAPTRAYIEKRDTEQRALANKRAACDAKKQVINDKKPKASTLNPQDQAALATVERDYALNCN